MKTFSFKSVEDFLEVAAHVTPLTFGEIKIGKEVLISYKFRETPTVVKINHEGVFIEANAFDEVTFAASDMLDIIEGDPFYDIDIKTLEASSPRDEDLLLVLKEYRKLCSFLKNINK